MSDNPPSEPAPPAEVGNSTTITNRSGGVDISGAPSIGGDVVGRDKTTMFDQRGQQVGSQINVDGNYIGAPVPGVLSLHQLPSPPGDFTGRDADLTELLAQVATEGVTLFGLYGLGGIGKTALALKLA